MLSRYQIDKAMSQLGLVLNGHHIFIEYITSGGRKHILTVSTDAKFNDPEWRTVIDYIYDNINTEYAGLSFEEMFYKLFDK